MPASVIRGVRVSVPIGLLAAIVLGAQIALAQALSPATERLFDAVWADDIAKVKAAVNAGADLAAINDLGVRPVDMAVDKGHYDIAHYLLSVEKLRRDSVERQTASPTPAERTAARAVQPAPLSSSTGSGWLTGDNPSGARPAPAPQPAPAAPVQAVVPAPAVASASAAAAPSPQVRPVQQENLWTPEAGASGQAPALRIVGVAEPQDIPEPVPAPAVGAADPPVPQAPVRRLGEPESAPSWLERVTKIFTPSEAAAPNPPAKAAPAPAVAPEPAAAATLPPAPEPVPKPEAAAGTSPFRPEAAAESSDAPRSSSSWLDKVTDVFRSKPAPAEPASATDPALTTPAPTPAISEAPASPVPQAPEPVAIANPAAPETPAVPDPPAPADPPPAAETNPARAEGKTAVLPADPVPERTPEPAVVAVTPPPGPVFATAPEVPADEVFSDETYVGEGSLAASAEPPAPAGSNLLTRIADIFRPDDGPGEMVTEAAAETAGDTAEVSAVPTEAVPEPASTLAIAESTAEPAPAELAETGMTKSGSDTLFGRLANLFSADRPSAETAIGSAPPMPDSAPRASAPASETKPEPSPDREPQAPEPVTRAAEAKTLPVGNAAMAEVAEASGATTTDTPGLFDQVSTWFGGRSETDTTEAAPSASEPAAKPRPGTVRKVALPPDAAPAETAAPPVPQPAPATAARPALPLPSAPVGTPASPATQSAAQVAAVPTGPDERGARRVLSPDDVRASLNPATPPAPMDALPPLSGVTFKLTPTSGLERHLSEVQSSQCIDKNRWNTVYCIEPMAWPDDIAEVFQVSTNFYRGKRAIVEYVAGRATQYHIMFPAGELRRVSEHFTGRYGPPTEMPEVWTALIGEPKRPNRTLRWRSRDPQTGAEAVLEIREIDDLRWSSPPDVKHGVVRLYTKGRGSVFELLSSTDLLLVQLRRR